MLKNSQRQKKPGGAGSSGSRVRHERVEGEGRGARGERSDRFRKQQTTHLLISPTTIIPSTTLIYHTGAHMKASMRLWKNVGISLVLLLVTFTIICQLELVRSFSVSTRRSRRHRLNSRVKPGSSVSRSGSSSASIKMTTLGDLDWKTLDPNALDIDSLPSFGRDEEDRGVEPSPPCRWYKNDAYRNAIMNEWLKDDNEYDDNRHDDKVQICSLEYSDDEDGTPLYGTVVRRIDPTSESSSSSSSSLGAMEVPGILFFHTAAGPRDIFLLWKAYVLARNTKLFPQGCVIFIADLLSDSFGWGWDDDRTRYQRQQEKLFGTHQDDRNKERRVLQHRVQKSLDILRNLHGVDNNRIGALGWCLGGHSILELGRLQQASVKAMATFHGVFRGIKSPPVDEERARSIDSMGDGAPKIVIAHGENDPFVTSQDLDTAAYYLNASGIVVDIVSLDAKHGFSNPAQAFNENSAFDYSKEAASISWDKTIELFRDKLS